MSQISLLCRHDELLSIIEGCWWKRREAGQPGIPLPGFVLAPFPTSHTHTLAPKFHVFNPHNNYDKVPPPSVNSCVGHQYDQALSQRSPDSPLLVRNGILFVHELVICSWNVLECNSSVHVRVLWTWKDERFSFLTTHLVRTYLANDAVRRQAST